MNARRYGTKPGLARTLDLYDLTADHCDVYIADEGLTLRFERTSDGIRGRFYSRDTSDSPTRASDPGFTQARKLAVRRMGQFQKVEGHREKYVEPMCEHSSMVECVLTYAKRTYSYYCRPDLPLTWENLLLAGSEIKEGGESTFLTPGEIVKLKQRALSKIKTRRRDDYEDDGQGPKRTKTQLELLLERV